MSQTQRISSNNTAVIRRPDGYTEVFLHSTPVVTISQHGTIVLRTGGWKTHTTKTRMNQVSNEMNLGFGVFQVKGKWFVDYEGQTLPFETDTLIVRHAERVQG